VRVEQGLNRAIWAHGIRNLDRKIRIRVSRQRNEDEDAKEKFFSLIQHVAVEDFKGLQTERTKN
jgi:large subunit ribosomal protein L31e